MPSSPQTVTTRGVFDYLLDTAGKPLVGKTVNCTLNFNGSSVTSPIVNVGELQQSTVTDQNGFWRFLLVPNDIITPSGTLYSINSGNISSYDISVPSGGADVQSSSILANVPSVLSPALTNLTGPITVTGNETVSGNLTVQGTTSLGSTTTGATTTGAETVGGDLTIASAFRLLFGAAVSKIVPGATSISLRDTGDANDNLIVTNTGNVTIRGSETITGGGWTLTAGDAVITAGRFLLNAAAAKIKGGATSLSLRNNADTADNVLVADAGTVTLRNQLLIPPVAAGTVASTSYGTVTLKLGEQTGTGASGVLTFSSIPAGFRNLLITFYGLTSVAAAQSITMQLNGDTAAHYVGNNTDFSNATAFGEFLATTSATVGSVGGTTSSNPGSGYIRIFGYNQSAQRITWIHQAMRVDSSGAGGTHAQIGGGVWQPTSLAALTSLTLTLASGNWNTASYAVLEGEP